MPLVVARTPSGDVLGTTALSLNGIARSMEISTPGLYRYFASRDDLVKTNAGIVKSVASEIKRVAPNAIIIVVSNPLDAMCYVAFKESGVVIYIQAIRGNGQAAS